MPVAHPPLEEYLQVIAFLTEEGGPVIQARLVARLKKTPAAVSEVIIRLEADGYLLRHGRSIELTKAGEQIATGVIRRHRLAERILVDVIGIPWSAAHREAGRWEHVISDEVEQRLVALLGDPPTCPHGNPIPGSANRAPKRTALVTLGDIEPGRQLRLERLTEDIEEQQELLEYLERSGLVPGVTATVRDRQSDGTVTLVVGTSILALGPELSGKMLVVALPLAISVDAS